MRYPEAGEGKLLAKQNATTYAHATTELLRDLLILQLGLAKVPQDKIRKIAGCGMNRVNDILKHVPKSNRKSSRDDGQ